MCSFLLSDFGRPRSAHGNHRIELLWRKRLGVRIGLCSGKDRLARFYQPAGTEPFPAVVQGHRGSWAGNDRTDGQNISLDLVEAGILLLAIEFRNSPEAPYPDINYGIRWLKAQDPAG